MRGIKVLKRGDFCGRRQVRSRYNARESYQTTLKKSFCKKFENFWGLMVLSFGVQRYCHNTIKLQCPAQLVRRTFVCTSDKYTQYLECLNHHLQLLSWVDQNSA